MNNESKLETTNSSRAEVLELLSEYTQKMKSYLDLEIESELREESSKRILMTFAASIAAAGAVFSSVEVFSVFNLEESVIKTPIVLPVFAGVLGAATAIFFVFSTLTSNKRNARNSKKSHEVELTAKILERILSRAVQYVDHNRHEMDFTFEIKIAEAQAVLSQFKKQAE